jgi:hypothetical protein
VVGTALVCVLGARSLVRCATRSRRRGRDGRRSVADPRDVCLAAAGFVVAWVTLTGNVAEIGENHRFRYPVEPLVLAVVAWALWWAASHLRARVVAGRRARPAAARPGGGR